MAKDPNSILDLFNPRLIVEGITAGDTMKRAAEAGFQPLNPSFIKYNGTNAAAADAAMSAADKQWKKDNVSEVHKSLRQGGIINKGDKYYP